MKLFTKIKLDKIFFLKCIWIAAMTAIFVIAAKTDSQAEKVEVNGITEPVRDITLGFDFTGKIDKIFFREGSFIKKNQTILHLEKKLEELETERRKLIWESKAELEASIERVRTLGTIYNSTQELFEKTGSISKEERDTKELEYKLAISEQKRLASTEEREKLEYEISVQNLAKRNLVSPVDGVIVKLLREEGESCDENQPVVRVVNTSTCLFVCNVEEKTGRELKKQQKVLLKVRTGNNTIEKQGIISFVSPVVDQASGLLEVKVEFDNKNHEVRPGVSASMIVDIP